MTSEVAIANRALTKLGAARILALTDDVKNAREINSMFESVRDDELRRHNWNFAITRTSLAALVATPSWGYERQFQLPSDCLRVVQVDEFYYVSNLSDYRTTADAPFQIEGRKILTSLDAPLKIRYVFRETDPQQWDSSFIEAFACRLALEACDAITQSNTKKDIIGREYDMAIKMAKRVDAIENPPDAMPDDSWIMSRLVY